MNTRFRNGVFVLWITELHNVNESEPTCRLFTEKPNTWLSSQVRCFNVSQKCSVWHIDVSFGGHAKRCAVCDISTSFPWAQWQKCSMWHIHRRFPWSHSQKARCDVYRCFLQAYSRECRSQRQRCLRRGSAAVRLLGLRVRIPPGHGCLSWVLCVFR